MHLWDLVGFRATRGVSSMTPNSPYLAAVWGAGWSTDAPWFANPTPIRFGGARVDHKGPDVSLRVVRSNRGV